MVQHNVDEVKAAAESERLNHASKNRLIDMLVANSESQPQRAALREKLEQLSLPALRLRAKQLVPAVKTKWETGTITEISEKGVWVVVPRMQTGYHFVGSIEVDKSKQAILIPGRAAPLSLAAWSVQYQASSAEWVDHAPEISIQIINGILSPACASVVVMDHGTQYEVTTASPPLLNAAALRSWQGQQKFYGGVVSGRAMIASDLRQAEQERNAREDALRRKFKAKWEKQMAKDELEAIVSQILRLQRFCRGFLVRRLHRAAKSFAEKAGQLDAKMACMQSVMTGDLDMSVASRLRSVRNEQMAALGTVLPPPFTILRGVHSQN